ncbi:hypothetical protein RvY_10405-2 [Ramazzottius varieornatus]|uniref:Uncharacterized protein n=1 Tax=Ramazzottius varieornatus TaxID=947166 RepID=A0A1D1VH44_RAMVA|nr:hypothetical protein RvY_10405-2 [Ramazzottius varieornatus]
MFGDSIMRVGTENDAKAAAENEAFVRTTVTKRMRKKATKKGETGMETVKENESMPKAVTPLYSAETLPEISDVRENSVLDSSFDGPPSNMAEVEVSTEHVQEDRSDDGRLVIDKEAHIERVTGRVSAEFTNKAAPTATKEDNDKDDTSGASPLKRGHGRPAKGAAKGAKRNNRTNTAQTSQPRSKAKEPEPVDCSEDEDLEEDDNIESANKVFKDAVFHSTAAI